MDLLGSLAVIALIFIVGAKLYTVRKGKIRQASTSRPDNLEGLENNTVEPTDLDLDLAEGNTKKGDVWDEGYLILIALILCGPLGLILVWRTDKWDSNTKMKLTIILCCRYPTACDFENHLRLKLWINWLVLGLYKHSARARILANLSNQHHQRSMV